jgi:uncharacterized protein (DUF2141 family)
VKLGGSRKRGFRAAACGLLTLGACLAAVSAAAAEVRVVVEGMRSDKGDLLVAVCGEEAFLTAECRHTARAPAAGGEATVIDVPAGAYAVQAFHDENRNGTIDYRLGFRPLEGMGFSRDAPMRRGPPRFADAMFDLREPGGTLTLTMRYFQ